MRIALVLSLLAAPALVATSALADTTPYTLTATADAAKKGAPGKIHVRVTPAAGHHMNKDFPTSLTLVPPAGVTLPKAQLSAKDASKLVEGELAFDVEFTAADAGKKDVTGTAKFAVCTEKNCAPQTAKVLVSLDVK